MYPQSSVPSNVYLGGHVCQRCGPVLEVMIDHTIICKVRTSRLTTHVRNELSCSCNCTEILYYLYCIWSENQNRDTPTDENWNKQFEIGIDKIAQYKYSKDFKKINDRSGTLEKRWIEIQRETTSSDAHRGEGGQVQEWHDGIVELLEKKGVRILSFYDAL